MWNSTNIQSGFFLFHHLITFYEVIKTVKVDNKCLLASDMHRSSRRGALPARPHSNSRFCYLLMSWPPGQKVFRCLLDKANKMSKKSAQIPSQVTPWLTHLPCAVKITMGWMASHSSRWTLLFKGHPPSAFRTAPFLCSSIKVLETILRVWSILVHRCSTLVSVEAAGAPWPQHWSIVLLGSSIRRCRTWNGDSSHRLCLPYCPVVMSVWMVAPLSCSEPAEPRPLWSSWFHVCSEVPSGTSPPILLPPPIRGALLSSQLIFLFFSEHSR